MANMLERYKQALERLVSDRPMIKGKETGVTSPECKARILYVKRVLETVNNIDAIEAGVTAEMEKQIIGRPIVSETLVHEQPADERD